jgi:hypothetical protein
VKRHPARFKVLASGRRRWGKTRLGVNLWLSFSPTAHTSRTLTPPAHHQADKPEQHQGHYVVGGLDWALS